ncbi:cupin domain-containing protein (plasmid) [Halobacterium sp. MBLA0001]|uniref:cupin domain-containing protein n=1 Tax=Halobacterium sp. MBLA0001 TaxID=3413511 RepID=UPI003C77D3C2
MPDSDPPQPELTTLDSLTKAPHAEIFEERRPRTVRLQLDAGERVPPHTHPGTHIVLHLVSGHLELSLDDETYDVNPGELVRCSGECKISPHALEPSTAVIVFAPTETDGE